MTEDPTAGIAEQVENAAHALDAYEQRAFPGQPITHRHGYEDSDVMLRSLLNDLQHYADYQGVDFERALMAARELHADELTELRATPLTRSLHTHFPNGALVQPSADSVLDEGRLGVPMRGIVVSSRPSEWGSDLCTVRFPGMAGTQEIAATQLEPADTFHSVRLVDTTLVTGVREVEDRLVATAARMHTDRQYGLQPNSADVIDRARLADALGSWAGTGVDRVMASLRPAIADAVRRQVLDPEAASPEAIHPARLAAQGFPRPLSAGVPAADLTTGNSDRPHVRKPDSRGHTASS
ncbi:hypothetical protein ACRYCC_27155 [Actinomadura scrupuli]|uniref:hypothetical protein n=1 Tax=Actinomadura scrupuli TaxID=559629 RepID=UPI003D958450